MTHMFQAAAAALAAGLLLASPAAGVVVNITYAPGAHVALSKAGGPDVLYNQYNPLKVTKHEAQIYCNTGAPAYPVVEATIDGIHSAMMAGQLTCSQLVEAYVQRISAYDDLTNAIRVVNPAVMSDAASADAMLPTYRSGAQAMPLLFCVPFIVKDNYDTVGIPTANGAVALLDNMPPQDATEIMQIKKYGALILAKGNMAEWAFSNAISIGSAFGVVRNPYDLDRSTAGSSGGPACAASASYGLISMGTDTGNSIRGPSGHQMLVGLRSSIGQTSRAGIIPLTLNRDIGGPIGRSVSDVARVFTAINDFSMFPGGVDPRDPVTAFRNNQTQPTNYTQFLEPAGLEGKRIGILRSYVDNPFNDQEIVYQFNKAVAALAAGGAEIVDNFTIVGNSLGDQDWSGYIPVTTTGSNGTIVNTGAYGFNNGSWYTGYGAAGKWEAISANACPNFREDLETYLSTSGSHYKTLAAIVQDGLYHPSVTSSMESPLYQSNFSTAAILQQPSSMKQGLVCTCGEFFNNPCRMEIRQRLIDSMDMFDIDAFIYPGWGNPPRLIGDLSQTGSTPLGDFSQGLLPGTGAPGMVVPMGLHRNLSLPTTLQIGARPFDEPTLIEIAYAFEQMTHNRVAPPLFPECTGPSTGAAAPAAPLAPGTAASGR